MMPVLGPECAALGTVPVRRLCAALQSLPVLGLDRAALYELLRAALDKPLHAALDTSLRAVLF